MENLTFDKESTINLDPWISMIQIHFILVKFTNVSMREFHFLALANL